MLPHLSLRLRTICSATLFPQDPLNFVVRNQDRVAIAANSLILHSLKLETFFTGNWPPEMPPLEKVRIRVRSTCSEGYQLYPLFGDSSHNTGTQ